MKLEPSNQFKDWMRFGIEDENPIQNPKRTNAESVHSVITDFAITPTYSKRVILLHDMAISMEELRDFEAQVRIAKRELKEVYYTTRNEDTKSDAKSLVATLILIQKSIERIIELRRTTKEAGIVLADRKAKMNLRKWSTGLTRRVKEFKNKRGKLRQEHLERYKDVVSKYIDEIASALNDWIIDIETMADLPKPPD